MALTRSAPPRSISSAARRLSVRPRPRRHGLSVRRRNLTATDTDVPPRLRRPPLPKRPRLAAFPAEQSFAARRSHTTSTGDARPRAERGAIARATTSRVSSLAGRDRRPGQRPATAERAGAPHPLHRLRRIRARQRRLPAIRAKTRSATGWEEIGASAADGGRRRDVRLARPLHTQYAHFTPEYIVRAVWAGCDAARLPAAAGCSSPASARGLFPARITPRACARRAATSPASSSRSGHRAASRASAAAARQHPQPEDFARSRAPASTSTSRSAIRRSPIAGARRQALPVLGLRLHDYFIVEGVDPAEAWRSRRFRHLAWHYGQSGRVRARAHRRNGRSCPVPSGCPKAASAPTPAPTFGVDLLLLPEAQRCGG